MLKYFFYVLSIFIFSNLTIFAEQSTTDLQLTKCFKVLEDKDSNKTIEEILEKNSSFKNPKSSKPNLGYSTSSFWLKCDIFHNRSEDDLILEVTYPILEEIDLYLIENGQVQVEYKSGLRNSFKERPILYRNFAFPLHLIKKCHYSILLRIKSSSSLQYPARLLSQKEFKQDITDSSYLLGLFIGIMSVMILYNFFIFITVKDKSYFYYILAMAAHLIGQMAFLGIGYQYIWPETPWLASHGPRIFLGIFLFFTILFVQKFLRTKESTKKTHKFLQAILGLSGIQIFVSIITSGRIAASLTAATGLLIALLFLITGFSSMKSGYKPARFFLFAWISYLLGGVFLALKTYGFLPNIFIFDHSLLIGSSIEVVLLSIALADRINLIKEEREDAQKLMLEQMIENQRINNRINKELEAKVKERTATIEHQKEELEEQITLAKNIQQTLLPQEIPKLENGSIAIRYEPMLDVGGDFLDILFVPPHHLGLFVCDVSGHGVPAAMLASMAKVSLTSWHELIEDPVKGLSQIHSNLKEKMGGYFLTAQMAYINLKTGEYKVANAGHISFYKVKTDAAIESVRPKGRLIMDMFEPNSQLHQGRLAINEKLVFMTDGIIEAKNKEHELYEEIRTMAVLQDAQTCSAQELCDLLYYDVIQYSTGATEEQADDIAIMVFEYLG